MSVLVLGHQDVLSALPHAQCADVMERALTEHALGGELALEHLDRTLDPAVADDHFEGLALNCVTRRHVFSS